MILVVAANPAIDLTYAVDELAVGAAGKVRVVGDQVGGKPLNVARTLRTLGADVALIGLASDDLVRRFRHETDLTGTWIRLDGFARRTVAVVEAATDRVTLLSEPGLPVPAAAWEALVFAVSVRLRTDGVDAVVVSGSLPPGVPADGPAELVRVARDAGVTVLVDTSGPALLAAVAAGPDLVKPNLQEVAALGWGGMSALDAASRLRAEGARAAVVSLGEDGLVAATPEGCFAARPPVVRHGNPTGAGDAAVAALASTATAAASAAGAGAGAGAAVPWGVRLRRAAALGAAAAAEPTAGCFGRSRYDAFLAATEVEVR